MRFKILAIGDIVGSPGRNILKDEVLKFIENEKIDFCMANAENAAGGSGITEKVAQELFLCGVNVITMGDHVWKRKEIYNLLKTASNIIRPANYSPFAIGKGYTVVESQSGQRVGIINLLGRVFMKPVDCPFRAATEIIKDLSIKTKIIIVDMHAEATSEKIAMGWHLDGKVSAVLGTHTHVQTADETILPGGTAYITDLGMTGSYRSILGRKKESVLKAIITQVPERFEVADGDVRACGVLITIDLETGKAKDIKRVTIYED